VLGRLDKGWEGEGWEGKGRENIKLIMAYLLKCLHEEFEGKIILNIFLYLKICSAVSTKISCYCMKNTNTNQNLTP
jgi:hypothetical protein